GVPPQRLRVTWLIPLVWFYLAWTRVRHGPLFVVTATVALAAMYPNLRWVEWVSRWDKDVFGHKDCLRRGPPKQLSWHALLLPLALVFAAFCFQTEGARIPVLGSGLATIDPNLWPVELLPELRDYMRRHPPGTPIFNDMRFGGFLNYYTPELRVFIDD